MVEGRVMDLYYSFGVYATRDSSVMEGHPSYIKCRPNSIIVDNTTNHIMSIQRSNTPT